MENWAEAHLQWISEETSLKDIGGFSFKLIAIVVFKVWWSLSTTALDYGFFTVIGTDWILFLDNISRNSGPKNSLPLSCTHFMDLGYQLSHPSSKALATVLDLALSTGITSGRLIMASIQVTALNWYSKLLITTFHGHIMSTWTSSNGCTWPIFLGGKCPYELWWILYFWQ